MSPKPKPPTATAKPALLPPENEAAAVDLDRIDEIEAERAEKAGLRARLRRMFQPVSAEDLRVYKRLMRYVRPYWYRIAIALVLSVLAGALVLFQLQLIDRGLRVISPDAAVSGSSPLHDLKDMARGEQPAKDGALVGAASPQPRGEPLDAGERERRLLEVVVLLFVVTLVGAAAKFAQSLTMAAVSRKVIRRLREETFKNLVRLPMRFHQSTHSGKLVARVTKDINRLRDLLVGFAITGSKELCVFFAALSFALMATPGAAIFGAAFVLVAILPIRFIADKIRHRARAADAGSGDMFAILSEALAGQKVVKTFSAEGHEIKRFKHATREVYKRQMETYRLRAMTEPIVDVVGGVGVAAAIWFLGSWVIEGRLELAKLATVLVALQKLSSSTRKLGKLQNDFARGMAAAGRVAAILDQRPEVKESPDAVPLREFRDRIEFDEVWFSYKKTDPVLRGVSLTIKKGETVAIVGPSGSGKTSLVDLLPRLYDVDGGEIRIDGLDIRRYTLRSLRATIATVTQETILFRDTIRENISYGLGKVKEEEVVAAAKAAHAHDFIMAKARGYDTEMGERGLSLSGGERQRIAIARAILKDPPILILDEATSALDAESEAAVQEALEYLMRGRTTIVIAHRLATVRRADRIVVLDKGEIVEQGTHEELVGLGGRYARAHSLQVEAYARGEREAPIDEYFTRP